ncbi:DHX8 [Lepeophtheirus salmonis]|uniref:DHX8 n=1 Tax=Lepeophtheirus salmonis TaxID=72036 RepID=A0A7R8H631_LEPSM|nr:DHX8 [Lepeophtheirus salmonis]CAF2889275.1 DHX8 [Lepeophtheirus salmonis]
MEDRKEIEDRIEKLSLELKATGKKKKNFLSKSLREMKLGTINALQAKLRTKLFEMEEFQSRILEILSLNPPNKEKKLHLEIDIFSKHLPIYRFRSTILESIEKNDVTILVAETGSGKSTLVTQFLHTNDEDIVIYCCQPRKLAANGLMEYTNTCLDLDPEEAIVAFDFNNWDTILIYSWTGIDVVIIDETHERTLSTDLLLGIMKKLNKCNHLREKNIKTLIMSATIDPSIFYDYFSSSEVKVNCISIPGKTFPVQVIYDNTPLSNQPKDYVSRTTSKIMEILQNEELGDILAFLATPPEIEEAVDILQEELRSINRDVKIYPLHSKVEIKDQRKLFSKDGVLKNEQRVIISTNIAETSVTLPDITCVIDSGRHKEFSFDMVRNVGALTLSSISQSSALQRKGRAGRTRPGTCYRLYTKNDYDNFISSSSPEILCLPMDQALLTLFHLGFSNPETFDFIDPPSKEAISFGIDSLSSLGAIKTQCTTNKNYLMTEIGHKMTRLNVIPKLAHLIVNTLSLHKDLILDVLIICGVVTRGYSIFYRSEDLDEAKLKKLRFCNGKGDFITMIDAFKLWYEVPKKDRGKWALRNMISNRTMNDTLKFVSKNVRIVETKFHHRIRRNGEEIQFGCSKAKYDDILNLIYSSFKKSIAVFAGHPKAGYINSINGDVMKLHPSSSINCLESSLKYVCYDKILKTSQKFIFHVSMVKNEWLDEDDIFINDHIKLKTVRKYEGYSMMGSYTLKKYVFHKLKKYITRKRIYFDMVPSRKRIYCRTLRKKLVKYCFRRGRGIYHFNSKSYSSFKIVHKNESDKVELPIKQIEELMTNNGIDFDFLKRKDEPCFSFKQSQVGIQARSLVLEHYSDVLKCIWNSTSSNQTSVWINFNFRSYGSTDEVGARVLAMPSKKCSSVNVRVNVPSYDIGQKIFQNNRDFASLENGEYMSSTLCVKQVFVIPTRAVHLIKMQFKAYERNMLFRDSGDDTIISVLDTHFSNHSSSVGLLSNTKFLQSIQGIKVILEKFSSSFDMNHHFEHIKKLEDINHVAIVKEKNVSCLSFTIFGGSLSVQHAKKALISYFDEVKGKTLTLPFDGRNGHKGVLPTLIKKYGTNLMRLSIRDGVYNIVICLENKVIQITGQNDVISALDEELNDLFAVNCIEELYFHDSCIICEVSPSAKNNFRLQLCGHNVCHGCLQMLVTSSKIPIKCPIKKCDTVLSVMDIKSAISSSESVKKIFYEKCQKYYLLSSGIKSCPKSECDAFFKCPRIMRLLFAVKLVLLLYALNVGF